MNDRIVIAHGPRSELRIERAIVGGTYLIEVRIWEQQTGGRMSPSKAGFFIKPARLDELRDALGRLADLPPPT